MSKEKNHNIWPLKVYSNLKKTTIEKDSNPDVPACNFASEDGLSYHDEMLFNILL